MRRAGKHVRHASVHELRASRDDRSQKQGDLVSDDLAACGTATIIDTKVGSPYTHLTDPIAMHGGTHASATK